MLQHESGGSTLHAYIPDAVDPAEVCSAMEESLLQMRRKVFEKQIGLLCFVLTALHVLACLCHF